MSVLDRGALQASPLADLHAIASELSIDGYRRLRKPELIDVILAKQEGVEPAGAEPDDEGHDEAHANGDDEDIEPRDEDLAETDDEERTTTRRRRGRRGGRGRGSVREERAEAKPGAAEDSDEVLADEQFVEGVVELLANGSGFVRVDPPDPSDNDVYISSAQVKRCELVSGDKIAGPKRAPRRSERFASLIRIETINGRPAAELADSVRFDDLPAAFPDDRLKIGSDDPTLKAIEWLTPFGKGSRVTIVGASRSGKSEALRRLVATMADREELSLSVVLAGVRPEEISE